MLGVSILLSYDTYLMWFENSQVEFLRPDHGLKTALLIFPVLCLYIIAVSQRKKLHRSKRNA